MSIIAGMELGPGTITFGGRRLVMHCNHYNIFLQRTIEDGLGDRAGRLLVASAAEASRLMLSGLFSSAPPSSYEAGLARAAEIFGAQGFGRLDVVELSASGGEAIVSQSHYALGWLSRWGKRKTPGCFYAAGYVAGALAAAARLAPERIVVHESRCLAMGDPHCTFVAEVW